MTSREIKQNLLRYLIFQRGMPAVTEGALPLGICDVLAIKDGKQVIEFEIKTSKADLDSELSAIEQIYKGVPSTRKMPKYYKHKQIYNDFMSKRIDARSENLELPMSYRNLYKYDKPMSPNYFAFAVSPELSAYAATKLAGTPYGVYSVATAVQKMKQIHDDESILGHTIQRILWKGAEAHYKYLVEKGRFDAPLQPES